MYVCLSVVSELCMKDTTYANEVITCPFYDKEYESIQIDPRIAFFWLDRAFSNFSWSALVLHISLYIASTLGNEKNIVSLLWKGIRGGIQA